MDEEAQRKRISETEIEIYPLDRLLPLETVYVMFLQEYAKTPDRNLFFRDRKYQKMREGYAGLFVAISHVDTSGLPHMLIIPSDPKNDFYLVEADGVTDFRTTEFDVKEFTHFSGTFAEFVEQKIVPKLETYSMAITSYRDMDGSELKALTEALEQVDSDRRIWLLTAPTPEEESPSVCQVTVFSKDGTTYHKVIDLDDWLDKNEPPMVYQDNLRFK